MTGRGRPVRMLTEDMSNGTTEKEKPKKQKKTNYTEEAPSVQRTRKEKSPKHFTEETNKQRRAPTENTKAKNCGGRAKATEQSAEEMMQPEATKDTTKDPQKTTKAKTCGGKTKSEERNTEKMTKAQPKTPKDTTNASAQITKPKTCAGKIKSEEKSAEEMTNMQPETPKDTTKDPLKTTKAQTCAEKTKMAVQFAEETVKTPPETLNDIRNAAVQPAKPKRCAGKAKKAGDEATNMQPEALKDTTKVRAPQDRSEDKAAVDAVLRTTLEKLKIRRDDRSGAAEVVNNVEKEIITHLKKNTRCFKDVEDPLNTGSYYENLKICNPDEFDVMLPIPVDRVNVRPYGNDGAFYSVALKRGNSPLEKFQENGVLSASKMLDEFRTEVKKSVARCTEWTLTRKKKGCPAVTLITTVQSITISLDVVLSIVVKSSWPPFTEEGLKIEGWLGSKEKRKYKQRGYYLVPKYEGSAMVENDGVLARDTWRISFSHIEKDILMNHGSEKTCCEKGGKSCCRKDCLKLLKHLLGLLKERDSSLDKFCSYHAKTTLLHACSSRTKDSEWRASSLSHCFQLLLDDFVGHLDSGVLNNFFIPDQNLLSGPGRRRCNHLAQCIREECDKGFPIFQ
ncbi:cyclic GMP-AMP synthase [Chaetodon trifascialis]|uniref:cyclic GMP-AMP synthase n=1 Tax=Chaetodon trifascialis TaxID=109706 RepID=UPI0039932E79